MWSDEEIKRNEIIAKRHMLEDGLTYAEAMERAEHDLYEGDPDE